MVRHGDADFTVHIAKSGQWYGAGDTKEEAVSTEGLRSTSGRPSVPETARSGDPRRTEGEIDVGWKIARDMIDDAGKDR